MKVFLDAFTQFTTKYLPALMPVFTMQIFVYQYYKKMAEIKNS
jgi:hypothetical protein